VAAEGLVHDQRPVTSCVAERWEMDPEVAMGLMGKPWYKWGIFQRS
jgi:hypothetical protein